jgi:hypothetical protein
VANFRKVTQSTEVAASDHLALVDGLIGEPATAPQVVETALAQQRLGRRVVSHLVEHDIEVRACGLGGYPGGGRKRQRSLPVVMPA